jgi:hypothetical protein
LAVAVTESRAAAGFELRTHDCVDLGQAALAENFGHYRGPSRRHLVERRDFQVRQQREREASRDRRRGHQEHVSAGPERFEARAIEDSETMLLVDDRETQAPERDALLNKRVRTEDQRYRARGEQPQRPRTLGRRSLAEQERGRYAERAAQRREAAIMLLGE